MRAFRKRGANFAWQVAVAAANEGVKMPGWARITLYVIVFVMMAAAIAVYVIAALQIGATTTP